MADNEKIRHHFVPVFYLRGFCSPQNPETLWVYNKNTGNVFSQTPENVGYTKHYHTVERSEGHRDTNTIEEYLANVWEGPTSRILAQMLSGYFPNAEERQFFAYFMGLCFTRVPNYRVNVDAVLAHLFEQIAELTAADPERFARSVRSYEQHTGDKLTDDPEEFRKFILSGGCKLEARPEVYLSMFIRQGIALGTIVERMRWVIVKATDRFKFLTSDNPFFFVDPRADPRSIYGGTGLLNKTVEVSFPLSSEFALFASWNERRMTEGFVDGTHKLVKAINRRTAASASRFVYASENSVAVARMVFKFRNTMPVISINEG